MAAFGRGCLWTTTWPCSVVQQEIVRVIFLGKIWIYSGKESLYCRDLRFLMDIQDFELFFFRILLGRFMVFSDVFEVKNSWKVNFAEFPQLKFYLGSSFGDLHQWTASPQPDDLTRQ